MIIECGIGFDGDVGCLVDNVYGWLWVVVRRSNLRGFWLPWIVPAENDDLVPLLITHCYSLIGPSYPQPIKPIPPGIDMVYSVRCLIMTPTFFSLSHYRPLRIE
ncbi:hypothetical protein HN51_068512 [Arachis hypogaea]|nr:uncharacterized protein DS421_15g490760 [Arachis hypogaea]